jgi:hypothetical protein
MHNKVLTSVEWCGYNSDINGLVTRCSSVKRFRKPIGEWASSKLGCSVTAGSYVATKPKARSPMGFLFGAPRSCGTSVVICGLLHYTSKLKWRRWANPRAEWFNIVWERKRWHGSVEGIPSKRKRTLLLSTVRLRFAQAFTIEGFSYAV